MNGAESLLNTLVNNGVEVCFTNPGTSEMHFVAALDEVEGMRCVLCLFEGVLSGAADGYARMARKPASTLLHLGPGLGNALANTHNAKKGHVPMVNIVGDHATYHLQYDAPLTSDIEGIARPVSHWVYTSKAPGDIARDAAEAVRQAGIGQVATLMLPADVSWGDNPNGPEGKVAVAPPAPVPAGRVDEALALLKSGARCMVMIGGREVDSERGLLLSRIGAAAGVRVCTEVFPGRVARGAGTAVIDRLPYLAELAIDHIKEIEHLILVGAPAPVSFFAYPNVPSAIAAPGCQQFVLAGPNDDIDQVLEDLLEGLDAVDASPRVQPLTLPDLGSGPLDVNKVAAAVAHFLPESAVVVDEAITAGFVLYPATATARSHDWLNLTGGAIGWGLPASVGAAIACPERKVVCLEGDGSAMYTIQSLWTMARENLDITVVIFNNTKYSVLEMEFARTGARGGKPGPNAASVLDIGGPDMDFVAIATGMGVQASRATTAEEFNQQFAAAIKAKGPRLIDAVVPTLF
ncbi:MAG: acetolactate synthase large subunit [Gammaproteobacteria bacterium]|jgi:acetolactate synthase-1/2/3 large subunit|nr:acetolactate synthase large subunit [Gammaproteobacteria bacterium]